MSYLNAHPDKLLFLPLGGSGEIGMNLNLYGYAGRWLMLDCGLTFAGAETPGVDLILPDIGFISEERDSLAAMILTHGHEDHIGAVAHLWPKLRCPLYTTPFTAALVRDKLQEQGLLDQVDLREVASGQFFDVGPFSLRFIPLAHSIAEGHGVAIKTEKGTIFHTGDWKLDDDPLIGPFDPKDDLQALGDEGVLSLVIDSTNVFNEKASGSEADVRKSLMEIVGDLQNRVVITTFASNVARLQTIGDVARAHGRELVLVGRSMHRIYRAAKETGYLQDFPTLVAEEDVDHLPRDKVLIACTGCQGEPRAALARMARGDHRYLDIAEGDTVIFSSKIIPGNEISLGHLFNRLTEANIDVITEKDAFVHVSGHPGRAELRAMYGWTRPKTAIPVHGESRHLKRHADFARELGIKHALAPANGNVIEIDASGLRVIDDAPVGRMAIDGNRIVRAGGQSITQRRRLAENGVVAIQLCFDDADELLFDPEIRALGLALEDDAETMTEKMADLVDDAVSGLRRGERADDARVEDVSRIAVRRYCRKNLGKNPSVMVLISRDIDP